MQMGHSSSSSPPCAPANTMWRKLLYSGFETCFGPSTQGAGTKTHLKSRFCLQHFEKKGRDVRIEMDPPPVLVGLSHTAVMLPGLSIIVSSGTPFKSTTRTATRPVLGLAWSTVPKCPFKSHRAFKSWIRTRCPGGLPPNTNASVLHKCSHRPFRLLLRSGNGCNCKHARNTHRQNRRTQRTLVGHTHAACTDQRCNRITLGPFEGVPVCA